jgi:hypothetical protein
LCVERDAAVGELAELGLGGDLAVHDEQLRVVAGDLVPVVGEDEDFVVLGGFGRSALAKSRVWRSASSAKISTDRVRWDLLGT